MLVHCEKVGNSVSFYCVESLASNIEALRMSYFNRDSDLRYSKFCMMKTILN